MTSGDLFHLLDTSTVIKNHEGERFPLHDIVYDRGFALGNDVSVSMFIKYEHMSLSMTATCSLNVCILFHLG